MHKIIIFNEKAWLKPYIDMNTDLRIKARNNLVKDFFKFMNNTVFEKIMENLKSTKNVFSIRINLT